MEDKALFGVDILKLHVIITKDALFTFIMNGHYYIYLYANCQAGGVKLLLYDWSNPVDAHKQVRHLLPSEVVEPRNFSHGCYQNICKLN